MANIFGGFEWIEGAKATGANIGLFILMLIGGLLIVGFIIFILVKLKEKQVIEVSYITHRLKRFACKVIRDVDKNHKVYISKYKKFLPLPQEEDTYTQGKKDTFFLLKDNNGLHHTLRIPNEGELKKWYKAVYDIDLEEVKEDLDEYLTLSENARGTFWDKWGKKSKIVKELSTMMGTVFWLPNISEDVDWLIQQKVDANDHFTPAWYKNPTILIIGTLVVCAFVFIITLVISKKL